MQSWDRRAQASQDFVLFSFPFPWASQCALGAVAVYKDIIKVTRQNISFQCISFAQWFEVGAVRWEKV